MRLSRAFALFTISFCLLHASVSAQKAIQEPAALNANLIDDGKGVVSASVKLNYLVRRMDNEVVFSLSYSQITINAEAGYYYKGRKYGSEVPGLIEKLSGSQGSYPTIHFDIYYGGYKEGSFKYSISSINNLGYLTGDAYSFKTTKEKLDNPKWSLIATGMETFLYKPDPTLWMTLDDLIVNFERDKKAKANYDALINEADRLYNAKQLDEALTAYIKAANHYLADSYPKSQQEKIRQLLEKDKKESSFKNAMAYAQEAEKAQDYVRALSYYNSAATMGVDDYQAKNGANRVQRAVDDLKRKQEEEIKNKAKEEKQKQEAIEKQKLKDKENADNILKQKEEELRKQNEEELKKLKDQMEKEEREKLEKEMKEKARQEAEERKRIQEEEERKEKKEQSDRREKDAKTVARYEENMSYDPVLYAETLLEAENAYKKANEIKPFEALELNNEWWDSNPYMESFRDDLNEPRRQEAWGKSHQLLYEMESQYDIAKYYYKTAIKYVDRDSRQHKYLLKRIERINDMIDFQKTMIKASREGEELRKKNYETAKIYKHLNRVNDNRVKAQMTYQILTQDYLYPTLDSKVKGSENAIQRQYDFERRLNAADQQLKEDNLVTGVTSQLAVGAMLDESKSTQVYGNHSMGLNLFSLTGYANYPIVANEVPTDGYIPQTFTRGVTVAPFQGGFDFWLHRGKNWDLGLTGDLMLGVLPMLGHKNFFFGYGGNMKLNIGVRAIKLALEADWHKRTATFEYDQDVALSEQNNPWQQPTDIIMTGEFNYTVLKAGGGLHINLADEYDDGYIRLMMYAEKPSFYTGFDIKKPVLSGGGQIVFRGGITVSFDYAKNYPVAGKAENVLRDLKNRDFFKFTFGKTWTIGKTK